MLCPSWIISVIFFSFHFLFFPSALLPGSLVSNLYFTILYLFALLSGRTPQLCPAVCKVSTLCIMLWTSGGSNLLSQWLFCLTCFSCLMDFISSTEDINNNCLNLFFFSKFSSSSIIHFLPAFVLFVCVCVSRNQTSMLKVLPLGLVSLPYRLMIKDYVRCEKEMGQRAGWALRPRSFTVGDLGVLFTRECMCPLVASDFREFFSKALPGG